MSAVAALLGGWSRTRADDDRRFGGRSSGGRRITRHRIPPQQGRHAYGIVSADPRIIAAPRSDLSPSSFRRDVNRRTRNREHLKRRSIRRRETAEERGSSLRSALTNRLIDRPFELRRARVASRATHRHITLGTIHYQYFDISNIRYLHIFVLI